MLFLAPCYKFWPLTIWVGFIVLCHMDSFQHNRCSCSNVLNQNLNLKFYHMSFLFELFDIHLNEQITTCHKCNDFKWDIYIYIYIILLGFVSIWCPFWLIRLWLHPKVLMDLHEGLAKGHFNINTTIKWILATCCLWPTLNKNIVLLTQNKVFNCQVMKLSNETIFYWY
jgi:hypothetical protein